MTPLNRKKHQRIMEVEAKKKKTVNEKGNKNGTKKSK
jgi:hypothetical protein